MSISNTKKYIDADILTKSLQENCNPEECTHITPQDVYTTALTAIECIPAAEVQEIVHGHWYAVHHYQDRATGICSVCKIQGRLRVNRDDMGIWYIDSPYCPACAAKMDGKIIYE